MSYEVSLHVGYQEEPFYYEVDHDDLGIHEIDEAAEDLLLSADLVRDIIAWDDEFQATYNPVDARESAFPTPEAERAWIERGKTLAQRIKQESPRVASIEYRGYGSIPPGTCVY